MEILAVVIHEINGHFIHIFRKAHHDNKYVKIVKNTVLGKYILAGKKQGWQTRCSLDASTKKEITSWIETNTKYILDQIKELENK